MRKNPADDLRVEPAPRHLESRMRSNDIIRRRLGLHKPDLYQRAPSPNNSTFWIRWGQLYKACLGYPRQPDSHRPDPSREPSSGVAQGHWPETGLQPGPSRDPVGPRRAPAATACESGVMGM